ncbi:MAG: hypothetical protein K6F50_01625 [Kiritimatiellae bacterium]|nr:hypothetical protein [Kiritimatiellia bacterium]
MKIKKPVTVKPQGGAAIADRFKIDAAPAAPKGATVSRTAAGVALAFGAIALAALGLLVFMLYQHLSYMQSA